MASKQGQIRWREGNNKMKAAGLAADGLAEKENLGNSRKQANDCYFANTA